MLKVITETVVSESSSHIHFLRFRPEKNPELIPSLISCYQECFAYDPWHEWVKCPGCHGHWGKEDDEMIEKANFHCPNCHIKLVLFWPAEKVEKDIESEIGPDASCWLAIHNGEVIGFCWGYPITPSHLEQKLDIPLTATIRNHFSHQEQVAYQDEVGVLNGWRGHKIAKTMLKKRLADFLDQGLDVGIVRTREKPKSSVTFLWYTEKLGYEVIARYPDGDGRVILGRYLHGLQELL